MRVTIILAFLPLIFHSAFSQEISPKVVSTTGRTFELNDIQLDWTLGEIAIHTLDSGSDFITGGFHQPNYILVSTKNLPDIVSKFELYPNPVENQQSLKIILKESKDILIQLSDLSGKIFWKKNLSGQEFDEEFSYRDIPEGNYFLSLFIEKYQIIQSIKVIKID